MLIKEISIQNNHNNVLYTAVNISETSDFDKLEAIYLNWQGSDTCAAIPDLTAVV